MVRRFILVFLFLLPLPLHSQNVDIRLLRFLNSPEKLPSDKFLRFFSNSDPYLVVGIPFGIGITGLIKHDDQLFRNGFVSLAAFALNSGITEALRYSINRKRPFIKYPDIAKKSTSVGPSFPSGHASNAFALATSLSLAYPKWYIIAPSYAWAAIVGYSRMDLGVHYPSDVLAGAIIGSGSAWLTYYVNKKLIIKSEKRPCDCEKY